MCESVGGGGAELKAQTDNDRNSELWPKKQAKGRKKQSRGQRGSSVLFKEGRYREENIFLKSGDQNKISRRLPERSLITIRDASKGVRAGRSKKSGD